MAAIHASGAPGGVKRPSYRFLNAGVLVRFDPVASRIVNANYHTIMRTSPEPSCKSYPRLRQRRRIQSNQQCYTK